MQFVPTIQVLELGLLGTKSRHTFTQSCSLMGLITRTSLLNGPRWTDISVSFLVSTRTWRYNLAQKRSIRNRRRLKCPGHLTWWTRQTFWHPIQSPITRSPRRLSLMFTVMGFHHQYKCFCISNVHNGNATCAGLTSWEVLQRSA
jgi:hypothetical protein